MGLDYKDPSKMPPLLLKNVREARAFLCHCKNWCISTSLHPGKRGPQVASPKHPGGETESQGHVTCLLTPHHSGATAATVSPAPSVWL